MLGRVYRGNPKQIITELMEEMQQVLTEAEISADGANVLALMHLACSTWKALRDSGTVVPSFKTMLMILVKTAEAAESWTPEEETQYISDFKDIILSLGGTHVGAQSEQVPFMAPMSNISH